MKKYKDAESLFDNVEEQDEKENMTAAGTSQNGNVPTPVGGESAFSADYLEKILQIQRNFDRQQEQNAKDSGDYGKACESFGGLQEYKSKPF